MREPRTQRRRGGAAGVSRSCHKGPNAPDLKPAPRPRTPYVSRAQAEALVGGTIEQIEAHIPRRVAVIISHKAPIATTPPPRTRAHAGLDWHTHSTLNLPIEMSHLLPPGPHCKSGGCERAGILRLLCSGIVAMPQQRPHPDYKNPAPQLCEAKRQEEALRRQVAAVSSASSPSPRWVPPGALPPSDVTPFQCKNTNVLNNAGF